MGDANADPKPRPFEANEGENTTPGPRGWPGWVCWNLDASPMTTLDAYVFEPSPKAVEVEHRDSEALVDARAPRPSKTINIEVKKNKRMTPAFDACRIQTPTLFPRIFLHAQAVFGRR